jgi:hypothetical protein
MAAAIPPTDNALEQLEEDLATVKAERDDALFREQIAETALRLLIRRGDVGGVLLACDGRASRPVDHTSDVTYGDVAYLVERAELQEGGE